MERLCITRGVGIFGYRGFGVYDRWRARRTQTNADSKSEARLVHITGFTVNGSEVAIELPWVALALEAKRKFAATLDVSLRQLELLFVDHVLKDDVKLVDQGVEEGSQLTLLVLPQSQVVLAELEPVDSHGERIILPEHKFQGGLAAWMSLTRHVGWASAALLGAGAFTHVYRAQDRETRTMYAVKTSMSHARHRNAQRDMEHEVHQQLRHIDAHWHPYIVEIFDEVTDDHRSDVFLAAIVLEHCSGGSLRQRIFQGTSLREIAATQSRQWICQILEAMEHLHLQADILHRDVKLENVLLSADGDVKITDFSCGRLGNSDGSWESGFPPGTPGYVAPEVILMEPHGFAVDLFSFGVLIWIMLTGGIQSLPPTRHRHGGVGAYAQYADDHRFLRECVLQPARYAVRPLPHDDAQNLVLSLTRERPAARPSHADIRAHAFLQDQRDGLEEAHAFPQPTGARMDALEEAQLISAMAESGGEAVGSFAE